jgi:hypothetical protein
MTYAPTHTLTHTSSYPAPSVHASQGPPVPPQFTRLLRPQPETHKIIKMFYFIAEDLCTVDKLTPALHLSRYNAFVLLYSGGLMYC